MPKDCLLGAARRRTLICCLAPRSLPPVLLALALGRRVSRKSACKDRASLGSISRFVSARQLDLVYDRDRSAILSSKGGRIASSASSFHTFSHSSHSERRSLSSNARPRHSKAIESYCAKLSL